MQNRAKRILALLMMVCLLVGLLPVGALATQSTSGAEFVAQQLSLGDDLDMRYYVAIDESLTQSAVMNITLAGNTKEYPISEMTPNEDGNYVFTVALAAAQMTDDITLSLVDGETEVAAKTYSVQNYAKVILEGNYDDSIKAMVKEMLNYGAKAQAYFNYNTGNYANAGYEIEASAAVPNESLTVTKEGSVSGISFYGASLVYTSKVAVRFYFTADSTEGINFKVGETSYEAVPKDGLYYVEVPGINPQDYDEIVSIVVSNGTDSMTVGYSPLHYITRMYNRESTSDAMKALVQAMYGYYTVASAYVGEDVSVEPKFHVASATTGLTYDEALGTISNDGTQTDTQIIFNSEVTGSYARNWEVSGTVTKQTLSDYLNLSFGVIDKNGKEQWIAINQHGASLGKDASGTFFNSDGTYVTFNQAACSFYWREEANGGVKLNYKIVLKDDVLKAYFGNDQYDMALSWVFDLTAENLGGFTPDSEYLFGISTNLATAIEMTDVAVTTNNDADKFQVASSTVGLTYDETAGTITYDGTTTDTELYFGGVGSEGYARNWELTGTVTKASYSDPRFYLSFGIKDRNGKEQWIAINQHGASLGKDGTGTFFNSDGTYVTFNQAACSFFWREEAHSGIKLNYKIVLKDDVLKAYFGNDQYDMALSWVFDLTEEALGGFAVDSEYQLGIHTNVAVPLEMTAVATTSNNDPDRFQLYTFTNSISYDKTAGTVTATGEDQITYYEFLASDNNGYARNWEMSGTITKANQSNSMFWSFGLLDETGKEQWFCIYENGGIARQRYWNWADTRYEPDDDHVIFNQAASDFAWCNRADLAFKLVLKNDVLKMYFGPDSENLTLAWNIPVTEEFWGGFAGDTEYKVCVTTVDPCAYTLSDITMSTDNAPDAFYVASKTDNVTVNTDDGILTTDGSGNTETYFAANSQGGYATKWEMTGTIKKTNISDSLFLSFGVKDSTGKDQWFCIIDNGLARQRYWRWWDTEYLFDGVYVFENTASDAFYNKESDTLDYKLVIENDVLKMYFGPDSSNLTNAWILPLTNDTFGGFLSGTAYQIAINTVDPCAFTISDLNVTADGIVNNPAKLHKTEDLFVRDPFVLNDNGTYYLYGTRSFGKLDVFTSTDLSVWEEQEPCFVGADDFWGNAVASSESGEQAYWAPEVFKYTYEGETAYYMFATFTQDIDPYTQQASAILKADNPLGPFEPWSDGPITPAGHSCLDATLYIENGTPYMIYAHEWQCACRDYEGTGSMNYIQLSADLKTTVGDAVELFGADDLTSWWEELLGTEASTTTDGPFVYTNANGQNYLLWATHIEGTYTQVATKFSTLAGGMNPQDDSVNLYTQDGGHGMIFTDLEGVETLVLHTPNSGDTRAKFFNVVVSSGNISLTERDGSSVDGSGDVVMEPVYNVASKTDGITTNIYGGEMAIDSTAESSEIYFAADAEGSYARNWEYSGTITRGDFTNKIIVSFGVKDTAGKEQWFAIYQNGFALGKDATGTFHNGAKTYFTYNQAACSFYWREEANGAQKLHYKIVLQDDVLTAYFGNDQYELAQSWVLDLTDSAFGGFEPNSEYLLGMSTYNAGALAVSDIAVTTDNTPREPVIHIASKTDSLTANVYSGKLVTNGTDDTEVYFAADENGSYARNWELSGTITKTAVTDELLLSFGVKDTAGKEQWITINQHGASLGKGTSGTFYNSDGTYVTFNQAACSFYWKEEAQGAIKLDYKIVLKDDVLMAYFGNDQHAMALSWVFDLTDSTFGGFAVDSEYLVGINTIGASVATNSGITVTTDNTPNKINIASATCVTYDTTAGSVTTDGTNNTETYFAADANGSFAANWEMTGKIQKANASSSLFFSFGIKDSTGKDQWFCIVDRGLARQRYWRWWDTEYLADGVYVIESAPSNDFYNKVTDNLNYKLVIENDVLKMYFGNSTTDLALAWSLPLTEELWGGFAAGTEYQLGITTVDPCALTISDITVVASTATEN